MIDTSKSKETISDMMGCDGMSESKPAKDNDMSNGSLSRRFCRKQEFCQECIKNSKCLILLKEYAAQNEDVLYFVDEIEKDVINATTDDDSSSSSNSSLSVSSSAKKGGAFLIKNVKFNKSSLPDGKKRPIVETNLRTGDKTEYTMPD
eukprot:6117693-Ditylum_brightwellii.AAC.1